MNKTKSAWKTFFLLVSMFLAVSSHAKENAASKTTLTLKDIDQLVLISQDLGEDTRVYISVNKSDDSHSCFCSCRDSNWSCTSNACEKQNQECSNTEE